MPADIYNLKNNFTKEDVSVSSKNLLTFTRHSIISRQRTRLQCNGLETQITTFCFRNWIRWRSWNTISMFITNESTNDKPMAKVIFVLFMTYVLSVNFEKIILLRWAWQSPSDNFYFLGKRFIQSTLRLILRDLLAWKRSFLINHLIC